MKKYIIIPLSLTLLNSIFLSSVEERRNITKRPEGMMRRPEAIERRPESRNMSRPAAGKSNTVMQANPANLTNQTNNTSQQPIASQLTSLSSDLVPMTATFTPTDYAQAQSIMYTLEYYMFYDFIYSLSSFYPDGLTMLAKMLAQQVTTTNPTLTLPIIQTTVAQWMQTPFIDYVKNIGSQQPVQTTSSLTANGRYDAAMINQLVSQGDLLSLYYMQNPSDNSINGNWATNKVTENAIIIFFQTMLNTYLKFGPSSPEYNVPSPYYPTASPTDFSYISDTTHWVNIFMGLRSQMMLASSTNTATTKTS